MRCKDIFFCIQEAICRDLTKTKRDFVLNCQEAYIFSLYTSPDVMLAERIPLQFPTLSLDLWCKSTNRIWFKHGRNLSWSSGLTRLCRPPLKGRGSTYCFTAVSVSVSVRSHPKAPPAQFFFGCNKIWSQIHRDHFPLVTLTFRIKYKPVEVIIWRIT